MPENCTPRMFHLKHLGAVSTFCFFFFQTYAWKRKPIFYWIITAKRSWSATQSTAMRDGAVHPTTFSMKVLCPVLREQLTWTWTVFRITVQPTTNKVIKAYNLLIVCRRHELNTTECKNNKPLSAQNISVKYGQISFLISHDLNIYFYDEMRIWYIYIYIFSLQSYAMSKWMLK